MNWNRFEVALRYYGNAQVVVGHFMLLYVSLFWGLVLAFSANLMLLPWSVRNRYYDVTVILCFFSVIEGTKLVSLL